MKRALLSVLCLFLAIPSATAANKPVAVQLGSIYSTPIGTEAFVIIGKTAIFLQNINTKTADVLLTAIDMTGLQIWQKTIDSGVDEVATAITTDPMGNIWIAGAAALARPIESRTAISGIENPDGVAIDTSTALRTDMNQIALWKVSASGELLGTYLSAQKSVPEISGISANNSGVSIIGNIDGKPFLTTASSGQFGKLITIGSNKTEFNSVARNSDGSISIFGSSAETLLGKKGAGVRDGILLKVSKAGTVASFVRSSAISASRSWVSGDSSNLTSGPVVTGKVTETAVTKFGSTFAPIWTLRVSGTGRSTTLSANGNSYLAFTSKGSVTGITAWKPATPSLMVITFDSKGQIKAATALPGLVTPLSLQYSVARGVSGLATSADGTVSIFTLVSR